MNKIKIFVDGEEVPGETAISVGRYELIVDKSERFQCLMMHILNVPGFTGVPSYDYVGQTLVDHAGLDPLLSSRYRGYP